MTINLVILQLTKIKKHQQQEQPREYKEFTEERAKSLYKDLLLQFLRSSKYNENEASEKTVQVTKHTLLVLAFPTKL